MERGPNSKIYYNSEKETGISIMKTTPNRRWSTCFKKKYPFKKKMIMSL